jgi:hypothetical protein
MVRDDVVQLPRYPRTLLVDDIAQLRLAQVLDLGRAFLKRVNVRPPQAHVAAYRPARTNYDKPTCNVTELSVLRDRSRRIGQNGRAQHEDPQPARTPAAHCVGHDQNGQDVRCRRHEPQLVVDDVRGGDDSEDREGSPAPPGQREGHDQNESESQDTRILVVTCHPTRLGSADDREDGHQKQRRAQQRIGDLWMPPEPPDQATGGIKRSLHRRR